MELEAMHTFDAPLTTVVAMYSNEGFAAERGRAAGATECDAMVDIDPSGSFSVAIRRVMPTEGLQPEFRPWIGPSVTVRYTEVWEAPGESQRDGTFAVEIVGAPVRATGTVSLAPHGNTTIFTLQGTVTAKLPFLAQLVTQAAIDAVEKGLDREFAAGDAWLAKA
jgi:hypothetical protein